MAAAAGTVLALALAPAVATATPDPPDPGVTTPGTVVSNGDEYRYLLYTPSDYRPRRRVPLVVVVHGCQTTAAQEQKVSRFDRLAERHHFVVLYPDVDAAGRAQTGPLSQCWKIGDPASYTRGGGDSAAIADMTRAAMRRRSVDRERVYLVGISAGGLMASAQAASYPDLYAAVGVVESSAYNDLGCFVSGAGIPVEQSAAQAYAQEGPRARVVPRVVITSTGDQAFPAGCGRKALEQGLRTDNLVINRKQTGPISLAPASVRNKHKPGGYDYAVSAFRDPDGCMAGELTVIDGMPHKWPGGTADPAFAGYSDPKAPSGAEISWQFFRRYTKRKTSMPCAETPVARAPFSAYAPRRCSTRSVFMRLPAGARDAVATVNGREARVRRARRGVRVRVPRGDRARTVVVVDARARSGHLTRRHAYRGCGPRA